jgi:hypothetical protein
LNLLLDTVQQTSYTLINLPHNAVRYWYVTASNGGAFGAKSATFKFTVCVISAPASPILLNPNDGSVLEDTQGLIIRSYESDPIFQWNFNGISLTLEILVDNQLIIILYWNIAMALL